MGTMVCSVCGNYGIYWKNLGGLRPYTYCPTCGGTDCEMPEQRSQDEEESEDEQPKSS